MENTADTGKAKANFAVLGFVGWMRFRLVLTNSNSTIVSLSEPHLLAFVFLRMMENDVFKIQTDADKHFVLAALNLVECLSFER